MAVVKSNIKQAAFAASQTINFGAVTTAAGNHLVAFCSNFSSNSTVTNVSDATNGNWTRVGTDAVTVNAAMSVWYKPNAAALTANQNITVTSGEGDQAIVIMELDSLDGTGLLDPTTYGGTTGVATGDTNTTMVNNSLTTTVANDTYLVGLATGGTTTHTAPGAPWALVRQNGTGTYMAIATYARINNDPAGTISGNIGSSDTANTKAGKMLALQPSGGGAVLPPPPFARFQHPVYRM